MKRRLREQQVIFNIGLIGMILVMFALFAMMTYDSLNKFSEKVAVDAARRSADQLLTARNVMAELSPHITVDDQIEPFAATPAAFGIAVGNALSKQHGYYIKQTSKHYRNKMNIPDAVEEQMLADFETGDEEIWLRTQENGKDVLRYGKVLKVEEACIRCHGEPYVDVPAELYDRLVATYGEQGFNYKVGDIRGMISVKIPMEPFHQESTALFGKIFLIGGGTVLAMIALLFFHNRLIIQPHIRLLRESSQKLFHTAYHDAMTGMQNRRAFNQNIRDNILTYDRPFWLLFIDLDDFKAVNDIYGHEAGDAVLIASASRLNSLGRECEVYRMGGDEFVMMIYNQNRVDDIAALLNKAVFDIRQPVEYEANKLTVGVSIGAVHYPTHATEVEALLRHGDLAMYSAKAAGKNQYVIYDEELLAAANAVKAMENDLKAALVNEQFFLLYQPQYDTRTSKVVGAEALLRWRHPTRGVLGPDAFIAVAEESGLILDIGRWILYEACRQNKQWQQMGYDPINIAVNVTSAQLEDLGFILDMVDVIGDTGLDPDYLELEFIERAAINNEGNAIEFMNQLKMMRIHAAIDDFGTGYSSLSYITKYPIDKIKIDRMFIEDIHLKEDNATIVRSIISIAEHLDLKVLAEGVEKEEELQFLTREGCHLIQGFYFHKPLDAETFEKLL